MELRHQFILEHKRFFKKKKFKATCRIFAVFHGLFEDQFFFPTEWGSSFSSTFRGFRKHPCPFKGHTALARLLLRVHDAEVSAQAHKTENTQAAALARQEQAASATAIPRRRWPHRDTATQTPDTERPASDRWHRRHFHFVLQN